MPDGEWLLPCLAERPPTTRREVFAFDKRVSRCVSCVGHFGDPGTERWSFWRLSEGGSVAPISFGIGIRAFVRPSWTPEFFGGVKGQMHHRPGAWISHRALGGNVHRSLHCCRGLLLSSAFATDHTSPFAILGAFWLNTAPHPSCVRVCMCVSVRVNTAHAGDRPPKSGGARGCHDVKGPLKRADGRSKPATPQSALCAFLHYGLVPNVCISPAGDNGSFAIYTFFGQL